MELRKIFSLVIRGLRSLTSIIPERSQSLRENSFTLFEKEDTD
jgi:hypothetical protein